MKCSEALCRPCLWKDILPKEWSDEAFLVLPAPLAPGEVKMLERRRAVCRAQLRLACRPRRTAHRHSHPQEHRLHGRTLHLFLQWVTCDISKLFLGEWDAHAKTQGNFSLKLVSRYRRFSLTFSEQNSGCLRLPKIVEEQQRTSVLDFRKLKAALKIKLRDF